MNFVLLHTYSDRNKGDAAIVLSTIYNLRKIYPGCKVYCISTFSKSDPLFYSEHQEISQKCDGIYTAIFPQLFLNVRGKAKYSAVAKFISFLLHFIRLNFYSVTKMSFFITSDEIETIEIISKADVIISKGGSFLSSRGTIRDAMSLYRMMFPFYISSSIFKRKTIILSQSLGPFTGLIAKYIFTSFSKYISKIYLREKDCLEYINQLIDENVVVDFCPDMVFALNDISRKRLLNKDKINIGLTVVNFPFEKNNQKNMYIDAHVGMIETLCSSDVYNFYIYPQVITDFYDPDYKPDIKIAYEIYKCLSDDAKRFVTIYDMNYEVEDLINEYDDMDIFIGSRLHSTIFALSIGIPSINISYHGTKAEGTFELFGMKQFVVRNTEVNCATLLRLLKHIEDNYSALNLSIMSHHSKVKNNILSILNNL